jgi:hypothetical protein
MKRAMITGAAIVLSLLMPSTLLGWGPEGHEIVASLAQTRLTENAKKGIRSLIGDASLAPIANWADEVRPERDETYNWHFVDIPESASGFSDERDCFLPQSKHKGSATDHHNCVVDRIEMFEHVLSGSSASRDDRIEALKFLVHFVGDVHQPFHAIGEAAGGNGVTVAEFGSTQCGRHPCNLHGAWDSGLIQHTRMGRDEYVAHLEKLISDEHLTNGVPNGVSCVVVGRGSTVGERILADSRLTLISATGSTRMGKRIGQVVGARLGRTILELGGNNVLIISDKAVRYVRSGDVVAEVGAVMPDGVLDPSASLG